MDVRTGWDSGVGAWSIERLHAAEVLNVAAGLFLNHVDDVIDSHNAHQALLSIERRNGQQAAVAHDPGNLVLVRFRSD